MLRNTKISFNKIDFRKIKNMKKSSRFFLLFFFRLYEVNYKCLKFKKKFKLPTVLLVSWSRDHLRKGKIHF